MTILTIAANDGHLSLPQAPDQDVRLPLARCLQTQTDTSPILILVHGYSHHPHMAKADPSNHIYASQHDAHNISWPLALGYGRPGSGICVPFAWPGRVDRASSLWQRLNRFSTVYARSADAGRDLARLITWIHDITPNRRINILAHSLGARTALRSLSHISAACVDRVLLLGAAVFASEAQQILAASPAARAATFCNITARENDLFDLGFEWLAPRQNRTDRALGRGLGTTLGNWLDIQLDHPELPRVLAKRGVGLGPYPRCISHQGFYNRPGAMAFYRKILSGSGEICLGTLRQDLAIIPSQHRGSRLIEVLGGFTGTKSVPGT